MGYIENCAKLITYETGYLWEVWSPLHTPKSFFLTQLVDFHTLSQVFRMHLMHLIANIGQIVVGIRTV